MSTEEVLRLAETLLLDEGKRRVFGVSELSGTREALVASSQYKVSLVVNIQCVFVFFKGTSGLDQICIRDEGKVVTGNFKYT